MFEKIKALVMSVWVKGAAAHKDAFVVIVANALAARDSRTTDYEGDCYNRYYNDALYVIGEVQRQVGEAESVACFKRESPSGKKKPKRTPTQSQE